MKPLLKCSKRFIPRQTDGMICFYSNIGCSESKVIFKWRKNNNNNKNQKKAFTMSKRSHPAYFIPSQSELSQNEKNKRRRWGMRRSLRRTVCRPERPTLMSHSLQSITRPFQKRFREVFGNARTFDLLSFYKGLGRKILLGMVLFSVWWR